MKPTHILPAGYGYMDLSRGLPNDFRRASADTMVELTSQQGRPGWSVALMPDGKRIEVSRSYLLPLNQPA